VVGGYPAVGAFMGLSVTLPHVFPSALLIFSLIGTFRSEVSQVLTFVLHSLVLFTYGSNLYWVHVVHILMSVGKGVAVSNIVLLVSFFWYFFSLYTLSMGSLPLLVFWLGNSCPIRCFHVSLSTALTLMGWGVRFVVDVLVGMGLVRYCSGLLLFLLSGYF